LLTASITFSQVKPILLVMFSIGPSVRSSVCPSVCPVARSLPSCERDMLKMDELISTQIGTSDLQSKASNASDSLGAIQICFDWLIDLRSQEVKGGYHRRPKLDVEPWRKYHQRRLELSKYSVEAYNQRRNIAIEMGWDGMVGWDAAEHSFNCAACRVFVLTHYSRTFFLIHRFLFF